jgi:hypothetical protein
MKTIGLLLVSALSLTTACATDEGRDIEPIDRDDSGQQLDDLLEDGSEQAIEQHLEQQLRNAIGPHGVDALEDKITDRIPRPNGTLVDAIDDKISDQIPNPHGSLLDALEPQISDAIPKPHGSLLDAVNTKIPLLPGLDSILDYLGPQFVGDWRSIDGVDTKIEEVQAASDDNHTGEFVEDIVIKGKSFTLVHATDGSHYLVDADSNVFAINRR